MTRTTNKQEVSKLKKINDEATMFALLDEITNEGSAVVSIATNRENDERQLVWREKSVFCFDLDSKCGNANYNAISVIRDLLKKHRPAGNWTRKNVEKMVVFKNGHHTNVPPYKEEAKVQQ